ncbi:diguanylate cyclase [Aliiroseovarius sp. S1339]|uniref:diguanylate cyclase domain-containing protein n=1 Tax=Aliiroseovarius sp. S1339 TaxID=2936990 RepID=UPI0020C170FD|nr:diguanylate cyclase [Aliiroseovarius sp. S1339]MCK8463864.1 diguanylate cyclase [Aliiroseovarius sp. S1339]
MIAEPSIPIEPHTLDQMMPMHLLLDNAARVSHAGPTIVKVFGTDLVGRSVFSLFELRRPRVVRSMDDVRAMGDTKVYLRLKDGSGTTMVGAVAVLPGNNQVLMNLSFGYSVVEAVARYKLAGSDFAPTDLTVEMLYLVEAKTAAMEATTQLAHRLHNEKAEAQVEAMTDGLTGLQNRRAFDANLNRHIAKGAQFSLMHIDLDFFKAVNDTLGHAAGDAVLREVARVLTDQTRETDMVARVGGDEFVILFGRLTDETVLENIAKRIIARLERPMVFEGQGCRISASIGIARSNDYDPVTAEQMTADADLALYMSKDKGRACMTLYRPEFRVTVQRA